MRCSAIDLVSHFPPIRSEHQPGTYGVQCVCMRVYACVWSSREGFPTPMRVQKTERRENNFRNLLRLSILVCVRVCVCGRTGNGMTVK